MWFHRFRSSEAPLTRMSCPAAAFIPTLPTIVHDTTITRPTWVSQTVCIIHPYPPHLEPEVRVADEVERAATLAERYVATGLASWTKGDIIALVTLLVGLPGAIASIIALAVYLIKRRRRQKISKAYFASVSRILT